MVLGVRNGPDIIEGRPLIEVANRPSSRLHWPPHKHTLMYAHLARHQVTTRTHRFMHIGELLAALDLGWGADYERVALPRVTASLRYKLGTLVGAGVLTRDLRGDEVWPRWTAAWALPGWDGDVNPPRREGAGAEAEAAGHGLHREQGDLGGGGDDSMNWQPRSSNNVTFDRQQPPTLVQQDQSQGRDGNERRAGPSAGGGVPPSSGNDSTGFLDFITMFPALTPQAFEQDSLLLRMLARVLHMSAGVGGSVVVDQHGRTTGNNNNNNGTVLDGDGDVEMVDAVGGEPEAPGEKKNAKAKTKGSNISRFSTTRRVGRARNSHHGSMMLRRRPADPGRPEQVQLQKIQQQQPPLMVGTAEVEVEVDEATLVGDEDEEMEEQDGSRQQPVAQAHDGNNNAGGLMTLVDDLGTTLITETGTVVLFEPHHHVHSPVLLPQTQTTEQCWADEGETGLDPELDFSDADIPEDACEGEREAGEDPLSSWIASPEHLLTTSSSMGSICDGHKDEHEPESESESEEFVVSPLPIPASARSSPCPSPSLSPSLSPPPSPSQSDDAHFPQGCRDESLLHAKQQDAAEVVQLLRRHMAQCLRLAYLQIDARIRGPGAWGGDGDNKPPPGGGNLSEPDVYYFDLEERAVRLAHEGSRLEAELRGLLEEVGSLRRACRSRRCQVEEEDGCLLQAREVQDTDTDKEEEEEGGKDGFEIGSVDVGHDDVRALLFGFSLLDCVN